MAERRTWGELPERGQASLLGYVATATYWPHSLGDRFAATLAPDVAPPGGWRTVPPHVNLVWMGQRRVPGVGVGAWLQVQGTLVHEHGQATIYNPRYEIVTAQEESGW